MASKAESPNRRSGRTQPPAKGAEPHRLDEIDRRILGALRADGRLTIAGLAERVQPQVEVPVICSVEAGARAVMAAAGLAGARATLPRTESVGLSEELAGLLRGG